MEMKIGAPAVIKPGGTFPSAEIVWHGDKPGSLEGEIIFEDNDKMVETISPRKLQQRQQALVTFKGKPHAGRYRLRLRVVAGDELASKSDYYFSVLDQDSLPKGCSVVAYPGKDGKLVYTPDYRGNRIPDFSMVGYMGGGEDIPEVTVKVTLTPQAGDDRERIQMAIDEVSALEPGKEGFRGAVLLKKGVYEIDGPLKITTGGVVLRGEGPGAERKTLILNPEAALSREEFIRSLSGKDGTILITRNEALRVSGAGGVEVEPAPVGEIIDTYVPVGAMRLSVRNAGVFRVGDTVIVQRPMDQAWISAIGMDRLPDSKPWAVDRRLSFERIITEINGSEITLNAPIVTAIEKRFGGGRVYRCADPGRISQVGVEALRMIQYCVVDPKSGLGGVRGSCIEFSKVKHAWVRDVVAEHYYDNGAFVLGPETRNITVSDCSSLLADDKYFWGYVPRYGFYVAGGGGLSTLHLFKNCYASNTRHSFVCSSTLTGPNVFHHCVADKDVTYSEPHLLWSSGGLYDNVRGNIAIMNRLDSGSGHGWAGANYVAWNTRGRLICERPPTAQNWAIGHRGFKSKGPNHGWRPPGDAPYDGGGYGYWDLHQEAPNPISVQSSSFDWFRTPESTLEDHPYSYWMVDRQEEWIQYDLKRPRKIRALKMSFPRLSKYVDDKELRRAKGDLTAPVQDRVYFFDINVSEDGEKWRAVYKDGRGPSDGHDVFHTYAFDEVEARYVRVIAKGADTDRGSRKGSNTFHLSRVFILPEPVIESQQVAVAEVNPQSLYLQQLSERYPARETVSGDSR